jgi:hypothetical protein
VESSDAQHVSHYEQVWKKKIDDGVEIFFKKQFWKNYIKSLAIRRYHILSISYHVSEFHSSPTELPTLFLLRKG